MTSYYRTNDVYTRLDQIERHPFLWVSGNAWILIYGDAQSNPLLCVLAYGISANVSEPVVDSLQVICDCARLPFRMICFDDSAEQIDHVLCGPDRSTLTQVSLPDLKSLFAELGIPVTGGIPHKAINDRESSAYHHWQRANLGRIVVSDIDLIRLDGELHPIELLELKRSYISLSSWTPYRDDYANFNLLLSVAKRCSLRFSIAYNVRHRSPFRDDASRLVLFRYTGENVSKVGTLSFDEFVKGEY